MFPPLNLAFLHIGYTDISQTLGVKISSKVATGLRKLRAIIFLAGSIVQNM